MRSISTTREVLTRTSRVLDGWLRGLPDVGTRAQDGSDTWSAYDVVGHLVHGEKTDWVPRARIILEHGDTRPFEPFDRFAQLRRQNESIDQRLDDFAALRRASLTALDEMALTPTDLERRGRHPELDAVTLGELLAAWTAYDLDHIVQISQVMARRYRDDVGVWRQYLGVMRESV
ncbi:MAG: DinB family protein [Vicinamibacterales bacterium]|nr:DinB family protein [Vicinamibacterales bacterium]